MHLITLSLVFFGWGLPAGCGGEPDSPPAPDEPVDGPTDAQLACDQSASCYAELVGQSPANSWVDSCLASFEGAAAAADDAGCVVELEAYTTCSVDAACGARNCGPETAAYLQCIGGPPGTPDPDTAVVETGDTGYPPRPRPTFIDIDAVHVGCIGQGAAFGFGAFIDDDGSEAVVDVADTHNAGSFYEAHFMPSTRWADGYTGFGALLAATGDYVNGVSTRFSCEPDTHYEEVPKGKTMTYVFRVYDLSGLVDCVAMGHDPVGILEGSYDDHGNTQRPGDVRSANCSIGVWSQ